MDLEKIKIGLISALSLLKNEVDNIHFDELKNEFLEVIEKVEIALNEVNRDE